jgi:hypothetical protein
MCLLDDMSGLKSLNELHFIVQYKGAVLETRLGQEPCLNKVYIYLYLAHDRRSEIPIESNSASWLCIIQRRETRCAQ